MDPDVVDDDVVRGNIPIVEVRFGNVRTNIDRATFERLSIQKSEQADVRIFDGERRIYRGKTPDVSTFGDVSLGEALLYLNGVDNAAFAAITFAATYDIGSGPECRLRSGRAEQRLRQILLRPQPRADDRAKPLAGGRR